MSEWFENIGNWFITNKDSILLWLQSIGVGGICTVLGFTVNTILKIKNNTATSQDLIDALPIVKENKDASVELVQRIDTLEEHITTIVNDMNARNLELQNSVDNMLLKVNAILETESIKAQTVKDDTVRTTINNILTNAKYAETETRAKLLEQLDELKKQTAALNEANAAKIAEAVAKAQALIEPVAEAVVQHVSTPRG